MQDKEIAKIRGLDFQFHHLGGRLVYGTDTGFLPDYDQSKEFRQLMAAGFGFRDVLAMLTTNPVALFHLSKTEGRVMIGKRADLTILSEDPASGNPEAFTKVRLVIRGGKIIWRSSIADSSGSTRSTELPLKPVFNSEWQAAFKDGAF